MCDRCDDLEDEVRRLRRLLGDVDNDVRIGVVWREFGVTWGQARYLAALYSAQGPIHKDRLQSMIYGNDIDGGAAPKIFDTLTAHIRNNCGKDVIETVWGVGYALGKSARTRLDKALAA